MAVAKSESIRRSRQSAAPVLTLSPKLFLELDCIARTVAGTPLEVVRHVDMPHQVGRFGMLARGGYTDARLPGGGSLIEFCRIEIANRIDCTQVWSWAPTRPELDYAQISAADLYHFTLWHEIGHRLHDLHVWYAEGPIPFDEESRQLPWLNEVQADRFAWAKVYPGLAPPRRRGAKTRREVDQMLRRARIRFPRGRFKLGPLPVDPAIKAPASHVRHGVPFVTGTIPVTDLCLGTRAQ